MPLITTFKPIEWMESMATGIAAIDKQHHYLVDTLHKASKTLLLDDNDDKAHLDQITKDLLGYAIMHFETEEGLMQYYDYLTAYPDLAREHIAEHRKFSRKVIAVCDQLREGEKVSKIEVLTFLNDWLRDHVLGIDKVLGVYLVQKIKDQQFESQY